MLCKSAQLTAGGKEHVARVSGVVPHTKVSCPFHHWHTEQGVISDP